MTTTRPPAADADQAGGPGTYTHAQILTIISGLMLGMFLGALDQTIVSTSIRTIADDLDGLSEQAWVTTAYLITMTITTPIYGKLGDLFGRKKLFMTAISIFMVGSAACAFATSMPMLATARAFQGLGAGGLFTLTLAIVGDIVSPRERARYTGYFMAVFGTSSVLGPVVGGFFAGRAELLSIDGWRWVFLVNVPIGVAALIVVTKVLHLSHERREARVDWWGAVALAVALVPLLTVAEQGREWGWGDPRSLAAYVIGAVGVAAFVLVERAMGDAALIPLRIFRIRAAAVTIGASVVIGAAMFGGILVLPLYMQIVHGASPTESGFLMLPMVVGIMSAAILSGRAISRTGQTRIFPIIGSALVVVGLGVLSFTGAETSLFLVAPPMFVLGFGLGNCMQPLMLIMQSALPPREIGVATSSATFFRQIGGTLGVAVFLSILFGTLTDNVASQLASSTDPSVARALADPTVQAQVAGISDDSSVIATLPTGVADAIKAGFAQSMDVVFLLGAATGLIAFLILLLMPKVELRETSAAAAGQAKVPAAPED